MEILRLLPLFSVTSTILACGCGGCNYASDLACARCCTAYVKRATAPQTSTVQRHHNLVPLVESDSQPDALLNKYRQLASILTNDVENTRPSADINSNLPQPSYNSGRAFDFIPKASAWRPYTNDEFPNAESAVEVYNNLNSLENTDDIADARQRLRSTSIQTEIEANYVQQELPALQAIVQQIRNANRR
ncbi:hypothetical protein Tcan_15457 [Toxocara canis]|uniref:Uncharacterized protein n=1 Tax=Toxocara canis TaxID=6265 RepID=A0A0B2V6T0_TOXCA|nr:hypothetical protein Tcan_15457 [Toxocara canis]